MHIIIHIILLSLLRPCRHTREKRRAVMIKTNKTSSRHHTISSTLDQRCTYNISFTRTRRTRLLSSRANSRRRSEAKQKKLTTIALLLCNNNSNNNGDKKKYINYGWAEFLPLAVVFRTRAPKNARRRDADG